MTGDTADLLTLKVGEALTGTTSFRLADRASSSDLDPSHVEVRIDWLDTGLSWSKGDKVRVALSVANQDHSGTVAVLGQPQVGRLLWADPSELTDPDGIPGDAVFAYQWVRCSDLDGLPSDDCSDIPGADGPSYRLSEADENLHVGVRVSFHDNLGYLEEQSSSVVGPVAAGSQAVDFWTATVTVKRSASDPGSVGYNVDDAIFPGSGITDGNVTFGASSYLVRNVSINQSGTLAFTLSPPPPDEEYELWILDTSLRELHLADANLSLDRADAPTIATFTRSGQAGQAWSDGDMIQLSLKLLNRPAQGRPVISGTPRSGETLSADTSGITDPNGVPEGALTYQWFSVDLGGAETDIDGATGPSYTIPGDLEDDFLGVRVGFTDSHGFNESVASWEVLWRRGGEIWAALMTVGQVPGSQTKFGYGSTYAGAALWPRKFRFNDTDYEVARITLFRATGQEEIKLNFDFAGDMTGDTADLLTLKVGEALTGTTSFRLADRASSSDLDPSHVEVRIDWLDTGLSWSKGDKVRVALSAANQDHSGMVALLGQPQVGRLLWADPSELTDPNGIPGDVVFTYQWVRCSDLDGLPSDDCGDIPGADGPSYRLREADENRHVGVRVSFHDNLGYLEEPSSSVMGPVAAGGQPVDFWTATVTVTSHPLLSGAYGYSLEGYPDSMLTQPVVTFGSASYSVNLIQLVSSEDTGQTHLILRFNEELPDDARDAWIFEVAGREFSLSQASDSLAFPGKSFQFHDTRLSWSGGDMLRLSLKAPNSPARGLVITVEPERGDALAAERGDTLTADTSGITDPDGVPEGAVYTYQWIDSDGDSDADIPGATGPTYTVTGDEGGLVKVRAGFTDARGFPESVTSEGVTTPRLGEALRALLTAAEHSNDPGNIGYGSFFEGSSLSATDFTLDGRDHSVKAVYVSEFERLIIQIEPPLSSEAAANRLTLRVGSREFPFSGRSAASSHLSLNDSFSHVVWDDPGLSWSVGDRIRIGLSSTDSQPLNILALAGEARVGRTLSVDTSEIDEPDGIPGDAVFTYRWERCPNLGGVSSADCDVIPGAPGPSYRLGEADLDSFVRLTVGYDDSLGYAAEAFSEAKGPVEARSSTISRHALDGANQNPGGVWGNADTIWVSSDGRTAGQADKIFAYRRSDLSRDPSRDFDSLHASNDSPYGIWSDGETMFVVERAGDKVYAYRMTDDPDTGGVNESGAHDPDKDITLHGQNSGATGIWGDSGTLWVANNQDPDGGSDKIFAYRLAGEYGARDPAKDFTGLDPAGNNGPRGIWSDGETMFVVERAGDKVYAYRRSDGERSPERDIELDGENQGPHGAWGDDGELWVVDDGSDIRSLFRYFLPYPATGQPIIAGDLLVGRTLTADISGIADRNGLPGVFEYQWHRSDGGDDVSIEGATADAYLLTESEKGRSMRVEVSFFDDHSYEETRYSDRAGPVTAVNHPATGSSVALEPAGALSASLTAGSLLYTTGYWNIGATSFGFLSPAGFTAQGTNHTVKALVVNDAGELVLSFDQEFVLDDAPSEDFTLTLDGVPFSSREASTSVRSISTLEVFSYEWSDTGLSWSDGDVIPVGLQVNELPENPEVGDTLRAGRGLIDDRNGLPDAFSYQWLRGEGENFTAIPGATEDTYTLAAADAGHMIKVQVTFTDDDGFSESPDSLPTPVVSDPAANAAPVFGGDTATREVPENSGPGTNVGDPVTATDADNDTLTYSLEGTDAGSFQIDSTSGQIQTTSGATYDHESQPSYSVTVKADDGQGGSDTIAVTINLTDVAETPAVASVVVTSTPTAATDTYGAGETIKVTVTFDQAVTVTGAPRIQLRIGGGDPQNLKWADYAGGTGTTALVFAYVVQAGDLDDNGIYIQENELVLNNGAIQGDDDDVAATLTYALLGAQSGHKVDGSLTATNAAPEFSGDTATREVPENSAPGTNVGDPVTAMDADDDTLAYSLEGTDAASFDIDASTGQLRTRSGVTYDHEAKPGYAVTVRADDGRGGTGSVVVAIDVLDVAEPPAAPAAPSVSPVADDTGSLSVTWTAPDNSGRPDIQSYDLQYRRSPGGIWTDGPQDETGFSATITGLAAAARYQVQVRATNADGDGDWSPPGTGFTNEEDNEAPVFTSGATFSVDENRTAVGTVAAADANAGDPVSYAVTGGADRDRFRVGAGSGALTFAAAPDHENPADAGGNNIYLVTVTATGGTGARALSTGQAITVTVDDVSEPPAVPPAPSVSAVIGSKDRLLVRWSAPFNSGKPDIQSYDLRYRKGRSGGWRNGPQDLTGLTARITGLDSGSEYQVQVRATNADGDGDWSPPGTGSPSTDNDVDGIYAYWTKAPGSEELHEDIGMKGGLQQSNLLVNDCNTTESFRMYWDPATPADEWAAEAFTDGGASDVSLTIHDTNGDPLLPELTGTARLDGMSRVLVRVRGRFGEDWANWSRVAGVMCLPPESPDSGDGETGQQNVEEDEDEESTAPLTARFLYEEPLGYHSGAGTTLTVRLSFSEAVSITPEALGRALEVADATVEAVGRVDGRSDLWELRLTPDSDGMVTVLLPLAADCDAAGAVCTADGRMLSTGVGTSIPGPPPNSPATGAPAIGGAAEVGQVLSADVTGIDDGNGLDNAEFRYQWLRSDGGGDAYTDIQDATGSTYTLVAEDEGRTIKVKVSFTDDGGNAETRGSEATDTVTVAKPGRPQDLEGNASAQGIALAWKAPVDSVVTSYVIYRAELDDGQLHGKPMTRYATIDATGAAMAYTDADATAGVEYRYRVAAVNSAGEGRKSNWLDVAAGESSS